MRRWAPALTLWTVACGGEEPPTGPDPGAVFETKSHAVSARDTPFAYEQATLFRTVDRLPELDVRALRFVGGALYAGTSSSVLVFRDDRFVALGDARATGLSVVDLAELDGRVVVAAERELRVLGEPAFGATLAARAVDVSGGVIWAGAEDGLWRWAPPAAPTQVMSGVAVRDVAALGGVVHLATARGVLRYDTGTSTTIAPITAPALADDDVRALAVAGGALYAGSKDGVARLGASARVWRPGKGGLPLGDVTALAVRGDEPFVGHEIGATYLGARVDHYHTLRWIPAERVTAVAIAEDGTRFMATAKGVSRVAFGMTTLAERAARFEELIERKHWRMDGFVDDDVNLVDAWDPDHGIITHDKDNDGLWTQMQIGPWCMAYALTKDEQYYRRARKALDVMFMLIDLPAITFEAAGKQRGFVARSLAREDEGEVFESKKDNDRWVPVEYRGRQYFWKNDTSSDEYAGHFFGYPLFYDLCAKDAAEKQQIADRMRAVADYLIAGEFLLRDLDGEPTTYGRWKDLAASVIAPNDCAERFPIELCLSSLGGGGWLNSMEILGHLLATWHITGDQKYYDAYEDLYTNHRYGELIPLRESTVTVTDPAIANHSDHELALLSYFTLLRYEPNPERRAIVAKSIQDFQAYEKRERNPWSVSVMASGVSLEGADHQAQVDDALQTLREWSEDWRTWGYDNAHRKDAELLPSDRFQRPQFDTVFPYDEIRTMKWNTNPYRVTDTGNGKGLMVPTPWLIAYWKLRYFGVLAP